MQITICKIIVSLTANIDGERQMLLVFLNCGECYVGSIQIWRFQGSFSLGEILFFSKKSTCLMRHIRKLLFSLLYGLIIGC